MVSRGTTLALLAVCALAVIVWLSLIVSYVVAAIVDTSSLHQVTCNISLLFSHDPVAGPLSSKPMKALF